MLSRNKTPTSIPELRVRSPAVCRIAAAESVVRAPPAGWMKYKSERNNKTNESKNNNNNNNNNNNKNKNNKKRTNSSTTMSAHSHHSQVFCHLCLDIARRNHIDPDALRGSAG
jgi:ABC-type Zn2+ transport system substrate-binding protein/surface adhesin